MGEAVLHFEQLQRLLPPFTLDDQRQLRHQHHRENRALWLYVLLSRPWTGVQLSGPSRWLFDSAAGNLSTLVKKEYEIPVQQICNMTPCQIACGLREEGCRWKRCPLMSVNVVPV